MSEYHAAVGLAALDEWPKTRATLMEIANNYRKRLSAERLVSFQRGWGEAWINTTCNLKIETGLESVRIGAAVRGRYRHASLVGRRLPYSDGVCRLPPFSFARDLGLGQPHDRSAFISGFDPVAHRSDCKCARSDRRPGPELK